MNKILVLLMFVAAYFAAPINTTAQTFAPAGSYVGGIVAGDCGKITVYPSGGMGYLAYNCRNHKTLYKAKNTRLSGQTIFVDAARIENAQFKNNCIIGNWKFRSVYKPIRLCLIKR